MDKGIRYGVAFLLLTSNALGGDVQQLTSAIEQGNFEQVCVLSRQLSPNTVLDIRGRTSLLVALDTLIELVKANKKSIATAMLSAGIGLFVVGTLIKQLKGEKLFDFWQKKNKSNEQEMRAIAAMPGSGIGGPQHSKPFSARPEPQRQSEPVVVTGQASASSQPALSNKSMRRTFKKQRVKRSTAAQIAGALAVIGGGIKRALDRRSENKMLRRVDEQMKIITFLLDEPELDVLACDDQGQSALSRVDSFLDECSYESDDYFLVDAVRDLLMYKITEDLNQKYSSLECCCEN